LPNIDNRTSVMPTAVMLARAREVLSSGTSAVYVLSYAHNNDREAWFYVEEVAEGS
jgi:hypothetical protein